MTIFLILLLAIIVGYVALVGEAIILAMRTNSQM